MTGLTNGVFSGRISINISDNISEISDRIYEKLVNLFPGIQGVRPEEKIYMIIFLSGLLMVLAGLYISVYKNIFKASNKRITGIRNIKYIKYIELLTGRFPLKFLSSKLNFHLSCFMLNENIQRRAVGVLTIIIPTVGILLYCSLRIALTLWYTRLVTFVLCIMVPYYIFTLTVDYMKYNLRLKIPFFIDSFRSSFMSHNRIKPALQECSKNTGRALGRIMLRVSDSRDINESLCEIRDRINDTWFNIFVTLLVNYRENGGELVAQLYKLNRTITRYNNIEKKKNKRLIWYEFFTIMSSLFSLPVIFILNRTILGINAGQYYDGVAAFSKIAVYSLAALLVVRILRRM